MFEKIQNRPPTKGEKRLAVVLVILGIAFSIYFLQWFLDSEFIGFLPLYILLVIAFLYEIIKLWGEWYFSLNLSIPEKPVMKKNWTVDILTTYCAGEPKQMIIDTLTAIKNITYPHTAYLCDEDDDAELKEVCRELGVIHVTRKEKINAKAGNINNALYTKATGEICVILDPDHIPHPDFLDEVLPYFEDEKIGFVQVVQAYYNYNQTIIAKAAAEQTYQFYGPVMMCLNSYESVPAIGANCTFRRKALDSIGGHAPGLTEDMHTAMLLHAKGWKSVYNPVIISKGLVPWNFSGYCKQQLKWSRGTFDLLINTYPRIFKNLKLKQHFYFLSIPFFYLYGLIALIDFFIPIISLTFGKIPIKIDLASFMIHYLPLFMISLIFRQFNQRWLMEEHEKGLFILGGTLAKASWWINLTGLFYALINKNVPYIPTPKNQQPETPLKLLIPNFIVITLSAAAIVYGLYRDFNPFNIFMAGLAFLNIAILSFGSLMALQHLILFVHRIFKDSFISKGSSTRRFLHDVRQVVYKKMQKATIALSLLILFIFTSGVISSIYNSNKLKADPLTEIKYFGGKYHGTFMSDLNLVSLEKNGTLKKEHHSFIADTFNLNQNFTQKAITFYEECFRKKSIPFIIIQGDNSAYSGLITGDYNTSLNGLFRHIKSSYLPVFIALERDYALCATDTFLMRSCYSDAYNCLATLAARNSLDNIAWVWQTGNPEKDPYIKKNIDFISWLMINDASAEGMAGIKWKNPYPLPVIIDYQAEEGKLAELSRSWALPGYETVYAHLLHSKPKVFGLRNVKFENANSSTNISMTENFTSPEAPLEIPKNHVRLDAFYIRGVAYNPGHDWRDNRNVIPLTREKLDKDFALIKEMGANTIRRYQPSIYDHNILQMSKKHDLKVLFGFWFDPEIDYAKDKKKIEAYKKTVLKTVRKYKDEPGILGWSIGNETWGLLKLHYGQPYLTLVRYHYLKMIEELAVEIKSIDSIRPVFAMEEHTPIISAAFYSFAKFAPHVDIVGVNSYYDQNISKLDSLATMYYPGRQYMVSEFGPKGYWYKPYNSYKNDSILVEQYSQEKALQYVHHWNEYIFKHKENNAGGVAFCWQDRYEATATWFGITDIFYNKKPAFSALKEVWTGENSPFPIPEFSILLPNAKLVPGERYIARAVTNQVQKRPSLKYKWIIYENKTFKKVMETDFTAGMYTLNFKIPEKKSEYRLYLYATDGNGYAVTSSKFLEINWKRNE
jgi:cellulose synthase/poly-beta-1,6-N-acetylglucosamine synthase-like glycosyltransferase